MAPDEQRKSEHRSKDVVPLFPACVARPVTRKELNNTPKAIEARTKESCNLSYKRTSNLKTVREWHDVAREARRDRGIVHLARMFCIKEWGTTSAAMKLALRQAWEDIPPRPELKEQWEKVPKRERRNVLRETYPEEFAMIAVREKAERIVESALSSYYRAGDFYSPSSSWEPLESTPCKAFLIGTGYGEAKRQACLTVP